MVRLPQLRTQLVNAIIATHSQLRYDYLVIEVEHNYGTDGSNYRTFENPKAALPHFNSCHVRFGIGVSENK
jgi:hypothetical protein